MGESVVVVPKSFLVSRFHWFVVATFHAEHGIFRSSGEMIGEGHVSKIMLFECPCQPISEIFPKDY